VGTAHTHTPRAGTYPPPSFDATQQCCNAAWHGATHNIATQQNERCNDAMQHCAMQHIYVVRRNMVQRNKATHCFTWNNCAIGFAYQY